ncbi:hypothetical protein GF342_04005 [Candidatus Woesearchaeota archaeon]|nr:hypothetical protein [Candidatus Woesearchaeota archaeon]
MVKLRSIVLLLLVLGTAFVTFKPQITGWVTGMQDSRPTISIASWNIENFGQKKAGNDMVMSDIAKRIGQYDIVVLQEISNVDELIDEGCSRNQDACPGPKCELVTKALQTHLGNRNYSILMSPQVKDERYAIIYDRDMVSLVGSAGLLDDDKELGQTCDTSPQDTGRMQRQPFAATFQVEDFTFRMLTAHTSPSDNVNELAGLAYFFNNELQTHEHVIIAGDLNADCSYLDEDEAPALRAQYWLIPDRADTTVSKTDCTYDQMIISERTVPRFARSGVDSSVTDEVSDHYLIWSEFYYGGKQ